MQLKNDLSAIVERKNKRSDSNAVLDIAENERQVSKIAKDVRKKPPPSLFHTVEHWQDVMQYDLFPPNDLAKGLAVSKEQWVKAFDKLDINGDGEIDGDDLDVVHENQALSHLNVSQDHYRLAVAQLVKQFPEFADFTIMHEPILVFFAETNASVPDDAPVPDGNSMALFEARKMTSDIALLEEANSCGEKFAGFAYEMVSFAIKEISGSDLDTLLGGHPEEWLREMADFWNTDTKLKKIISEMKKKWEAGKGWEAALKVGDLLFRLWKSGKLESLYNLIYKANDFWTWCKVRTQCTATFLSGARGLVSKMVNELKGKMNSQNAKDVMEACWQSKEAADGKKWWHRW